MKKAYSKPEIYIEWFALYEHIASGCGASYKNTGEALFSGRESCAFMASGLTLFLSTSRSPEGNPCLVYYDQNYDDSFEFEVYHGGDTSIPGSMMFSS